VKIIAYSHHPDVFSAHSGMNPLVRALGGNLVRYYQSWLWVQQRWWSMGNRLKWWGDGYYGSGWNALLPHWSERVMAWQTPSNADVAHFIWAEFASPSRPEWFRRKARCLVGTFHATARKLPSVVREGYRGLDAFDGITLMSATQRAFFLERGVPEERMRVILHGVDTDYFRPATIRQPRSAALRGLLVGSTERDHAMMKQVLDRLPDGVMEMTILTSSEQRELYYGADTPHADFPGHLSDAALLQAYQQADLLVMPMIDCTANNAVLEAMACGTPVMVNRVGGIEEYVDPSCNVVLEEHTVEGWVDQIIDCHRERERLEQQREMVRQWAEGFAWDIMAEQYLQFYKDLGAKSAHG
jgi:glycosyltransferase involved in cell wall biosynthesis